MTFDRAYLLGINVINRTFPEEGERPLRIAVLRVHRAAGNAQLRLDEIDSAMVAYLHELDPICASKLKSVVLDSAARLEALAGELRKSVPLIRDVDELTPAPQPPPHETTATDDCPF